MARDRVAFVPTSCRCIHGVCDPVHVLELWQAEWCPFSHRVRLRLTELELDWVARAVPVDRAGRSRLERAAGTVGIPTLVDGDTVVTGAEAILAHLGSLGADEAAASRHRAQMRAEWPHWVELEGRSQPPG